jgi:excinuclease ABC subunit C
LHAQVQRVESVCLLASELVRPLSKLRAVILQASANPSEVAVFLFENGTLRGPATLSTIGMRIQNEQSGSTSLFAQPMTLEPVVQEQGASQQAGNGAEDAPAKIARTVLESRLEAALADLSVASAAPETTRRQGHLALLKRWYYRPEAKRSGEIFFPDTDERWPLRSILRGIGRVAAKSLAAADR